MNPESNPTANAKRTYLKQAGLCVIGYFLAALVIPPLFLFGHNHHFGSPWRIAVDALPIIPTIFFFVVLVRFVLATDELQRQIIVHSFALAGGFTAFLSISSVFLTGADVPNFPAWWSYLAFWISYVIAIFFVRRHYRCGPDSCS